MAERTFGWVQEAYVIKKLKKVVQLFVYNSPINKMLREDKIPRLVQADYGRDEFIEELSQEKIQIPYTHLKGKGVPKGLKRSTSPCSGIVQAVLTGQRKEYQSDWPADSFLRWAISIGFLDYDRSNDTCSLSELGEKFATSNDDSADEESILTKAFLSYPPICRIMLLLEDGQHMTKFEIGEKLGFIGEAGFTSIPQHLIIQGLLETTSSKERNKLLSDTEGTSDKYVRTICSWLKQMKWIIQEEKDVSIKLGNAIYKETIPQAYKITLKGLRVIKHIRGSSKFVKIPKRVMWDMLATKVVDRDYLRNRRTYVIQAMISEYQSIETLINILNEKGITETESVVLDDIKGLENIGLSISRKHDTYKITDKIVDLSIPQDIFCNNIKKSDFAIIKDDIRKKLKNVDHKYLVLVDLGFDSSSNRDYEIQTAELLTTELGFRGARLGDSRKPDVCIYYGKNGLIIDNKAYTNGYSLPMSQADEMVRYIEENKSRQKSLNPNQWWQVFDKEVICFNFAFVSGKFTGTFKNRIKNIYERTNVSGSAINSVNLLLMAEALKSGRLQYHESFEYFSNNDEIHFMPYDIIGNTSVLKVAEELTDIYDNK